MTARNLPAALTRKPTIRPSHREDSDAGSGSRTGAPEHIVLYLAVQDRRVIPLLQRSARVFSSRRSQVPLELRVFHAPDLPNTPFDDLAVLATLTEFGDVEGVDYVTIKPEDLK